MASAMVVWLPYMAENDEDTQKTTVYLRTADYQKLKFIARELGVAPAKLIREAVADFVARRKPRRLPRSLGAGHSASGDLSERAEDLLKGFGESE